MSDQIKVLSRDVLKKLIDGWGIFKACLTYRKTRPGYEREFYEIDKQVVGKFDLLILALVDEHEEPKPTWEPGTVLIMDIWKSIIRLDEFRGFLGRSEFWKVTQLDNGASFAWELNPAIWKVLRLPHQFVVGDWFATENNLVRRVAENCGDGSIVDEVGVQRLTSEIRHVPPPKGENPKKRAWDLGAVGGQSSDCVPPPKEEKPSQERHKCDACGKEFDPDDLQILCAKCAKMQIESILDCALHSELPTDRAVETSEKSHPDPRKWELCGHDVLKKDCPTCSSEGPFQGPH